MADNEKGLHSVETPAADPREGSNPTVAARADNAPYPPPLPDTPPGLGSHVYINGQWYVRQDNWREQIDLGTCDRMTAYAAGRHDGHQHAMHEFLEMWKLLRPFYEFVGKAARR